MALDILSLPAPRLLPPGLCSIIEPDILYLHIISDIAIGLAYFSIPLVLLIFARRRRDLAYPWVILLFAAFIIACGTTHLMHVWTMFRPDYAAEGLIKLVTAAISVATAILLWPLLPRLLALPSAELLAREVAERRAAEARALASEARSAAFVEHLAEALFVIRIEASERLVVETVNPAFERMFGIAAETVRGRAADACMPPEVLAQVLPHWRRAIATGRPVDYVVEAQAPVGWRVWETVLVPMIGPDGQVERLLGSARDITRMRRLQSDVMQSARLATIGTMCAGLAHETSQPLNTATLWLRNARVAGEAGGTEEALGRLRRAHDVIESQLRRAGDLVTRIRALPGEEADAPEAFDAVRVVDLALRQAAIAYAAEGVEVALRSQASRLPVRGVPSRLEQALLQLLANARDAVLERRATDPDAPACIIVTLREEAGEAVLEVEDTGPGVPEALREAIFDPFFTTREPGHGSGLGLPLVAAVARGMGGRVEARNQPGGGAIFTLRLALAPASSLITPVEVLN
jgi:PAS domain S-box-containing protein